jgi:hypothetical protein
MATATATAKVPVPVKIVGDDVHGVFGDAGMLVAWKFSLKFVMFCSRPRPDSREKNGDTADDMYCIITTHNDPPVLQDKCASGGGGGKKKKKKKVKNSQFGTWDHLSSRDILFWA